MLGAKYSLSGLHDQEVYLKVAQQQFQPDVEHPKVEAVTVVHG